MKKIIALLFSLAVLASGYAQASNHIEVMPWPTFQGNAAHTGFVPVILDTKKFQFAWKTYIGKQASPGLNYTISQVMVSGVLAYVSRSNYVYSNTLQAVATQDGKMIWQKQYGGIQTTPPAVIGDKVYMQAEDYGGYHSALNVYNNITGDEKFSAPLGSLWEYFLSPVFYAENVYFVNANGLYSYSINLNTRNWVAGIAAEYDRWTPAVNKNFVITYGDGYLLVYDRASGKLLEQIKDPHYSISGEETTNKAPVLVSNGIVAGIDGGFLTLFNIANHRVLTSDGPAFIGQPAIDSHFIYAVQNNSLVALKHNSTLIPVWYWAPSNQQLLGQLIDTTNLVFVSTRFNVYAISKKTHKVVWKYPAGGKLSLGMGYLFIMQHSGYLVAIRVA